jgi:glycosyltransferase involved in cell wall biosynthesis
VRILHTESSTGWGGQEIRILTEAEGMLRRGHHVTLVTPASAEICSAARKRGIPVVALPIEKKRPGALAAMRCWLAAHRGELDLINTHSSTDAWLTALARLSLRAAPPMVRTRHVSTAVAKNRATRWLYQSATRHIVTTGEALRRQLVEQNGFDPGRITSVRTGIDLEHFRPLPRGDCRRALGLAEQPTLGILATLRDWKGHDYLLDAWALLRPRFPDWRLLFIGDGPRRGHLERRIAEQRLAASVLLVGNRDEVPLWLNSLDLFALPSYGDEGVPQSIMQAMACGLAVVTTPVGAIEEAVQRDRTALVVPPKDARGLADALGALMGSSARRAAMGEAGRRFAEENFGIEAMLDRMETVFSAVLAAGAHG